MSSSESGIKGKGFLVGAISLGAIAAVGISALLVNISEKKSEERQYRMAQVALSDDNVDPAVWGQNFPSQFSSYMEMSGEPKSTFFGGSLPYSKLIRYPQLTRLWGGYPFSADFNEERSHYFSQLDQVETKRNNKEWLNAHGFPKFMGQPGACMNCHSGWTPKLIRELGWEKFNSTPYVELRDKLVKEHGEGMHKAELGSTCADCHSPKNMQLRVTRPAYINAMVSRGYEADPETGLKATRQEMRSHVCQQCHVEYYFKKPNSELTFPWKEWPKGEALQVEMIETYYNSVRDKFPQDWVHKETGAPMLKMQHPETELFSSGLHARSGVACADCHMPFVREGANKVTSHNIRSPLLNVEASCQTCHPMSAEKLRERVIWIQRNTSQSLRKSEGAILALMDDIKAAQELLNKNEALKSGKSPEDFQKSVDGVLQKAREAHRRSSLRWDFISSENSTGFHSPGEAARVLGDAASLARQGQLDLVNDLMAVGITFKPTAGQGLVPAAPTPIQENRKAPVGDVPPVDLTSYDKSIETK